MGGVGRPPDEPVVVGMGGVGHVRCRTCLSRPPDEPADVGMVGVAHARCRTGLVSAEGASSSMSICVISPRSH